MSDPSNSEGADAGRTQDAVFDRRDWLQITLSCIGDGVITADAGGHVNYLNPVAESLTGWTLAEAVGKEVEQVFRIVNETTRQAVEQPVRRVIERGLTVGLGNHTILIARDGTERPIDDSAAPIKDERGNVVGVVLIFRDITERRKAEHQVEWAKDYAESIIKTLREPMLVLDAELHIHSANRSFYQTFRVDPAETEGRFIYDLGDGQWNIPALKTLLEEIVPRDSAFDDFEVEHDFERIGRKTMLLNARRFPPEGKHELVLLSIEDVTDRKRMSRDLTASEIRYRRLFEAAHDGILLVDPETRRITDANPFMVELLGYSRGELVGKELWEIGLLRDQEVNRESFLTLRETGSIRHENLPLRSKAGKDREVEFVSNVYQEDGRAVIQCNIRDITERRRMAEERERLFQEAEVARDRAEAHEVQLADADRRKDEFLAMLAHELRNPLAAINGAVDLARSSDMESQREWTDDLVKRQVKHLARLIDDLLDVSRISQGKIHLRKESVELHSVVERAVQVVAPLVRDKDLELTISLPTGPLPLEADPTRLEQILVNLLNNAAKYTDRGGQIAVSAHREGEELCVTVRDSGIGIDAKMLTQVFDLFTQVDDSLDRSRGGSGDRAHARPAPRRTSWRERPGDERRPGKGKRVHGAIPGRGGASPGRRAAAASEGAGDRASPLAFARRGRQRGHGQGHGQAPQVVRISGSSGPRWAKRHRDRPVAAARCGVPGHRTSRHERLRGRGAASPRRMLQGLSPHRHLRLRSGGGPAPYGGGGLRSPPGEAYRLQGVAGSPRTITPSSSILTTEPLRHDVCLFF